VNMLNGYFGVQRVGVKVRFKRKRDFSNGLLFLNSVDLPPAKHVHPACFQALTLLLYVSILAMCFD
jgi:hypothetical protein